LQIQDKKFQKNKDPEKKEGE
jgi:hypothetical protein